MILAGRGTAGFMFYPMCSLVVAASASCGTSGNIMVAEYQDQSSIDEAGQFVLKEEFLNQSAPEAKVFPGTQFETIRCTLSNIDASKIRELADTIAINDGATEIYPGALIQGKRYQEGLFAPITIPRGSGTIYLRGLNFQQDGEYTRDLPVVNGAAVNQAIQDILSQQIQGTAAEAAISIDQVYSYEQLLFSLGVDVRFGSFQLAASLKVGQEKRKNYVLLKFVQKYYDVHFEPPEKKASVFRDGEAYADPEGQIAPESPPLYVSKVSYGRMVFFVMESEYSASDVEAALNAAFNGLLATVQVNAGVTSKDIMSKTKLYYWVRGGSASLALEPISNASNDPSAMFEAIKAFLANRNAADYSAANPGVPIAYTLNYLADRSIARMSYAIHYEKRDCAPVGLQDESRIAVSFSDFDEKVVLDVNGVEVYSRNEADGASGLVALNSWLHAGDNTVRVRLYNGDCFGASLNVNWYRNGELQGSLARKFDKAISGCGQQLDWAWRIDKGLGIIEPL